MMSDNDAFPVKRLIEFAHQKVKSLAIFLNHIDRA